MKINGKLSFGASSASEIQNLRVQKVSSLPTFGGAVDNGRLIFDTTTSIMYYGDAAANAGAGAWVPIATGGNAANLQAEVDRIEAAVGAAMNADGSLNASAFDAKFSALGGTPTSFTDAINKLALYVDAHNTLAELDDVNVGTVNDKDLLQYDAASSKWVDISIADAGLQVQDDGLDALAAKTSTGILVQTGADAYASRTLVAPTEGITITNADGVAGNPTFALANDLAALEGLTTAGQIVRTGDGTAVTRTLEGVAGNTVVTNGDGVAANPKVDLAEVTQGTTGSFKKFTTDAYGRVVSQADVVTADITALVDSTYVNVAGDTMTGNLSMGGNRVIAAGAPVAGTDLVNKNYADALIAGLSWKHAVRVATTGNVSLLAAPLEIDGVTLAVGDRVLVKDQTVAAENGIYVVADVTATEVSLVRADDMSDAVEFSSAAVYVKQGTTLAETGWNQTAEVASVGTDPVTFVQFTGAGTFDAGAGLSLTGNTFDVNMGAGITILPSDEVGIDIYTGSALFLTEDGETNSTATGAKLALFTGEGLTQAGGTLAIPKSGINNSLLLNPKFTVTGTSGSSFVVLGQSLAVVGGSSSVTTDVASGTLTISVGDASTSAKGLASFDAGQFAVVDGVVSLDASLDDLNNVSGADVATTDALLTKTSGDWTPVSRADVVASTSVGDHNDVTLTSPAAGEALVYQGTQFVNQKVFHVHTQAVADTTWTVAHYLGQKYCNVVIVDDADEVIIPESIKFDTNNQLTVTFNVAITGKVVVAGVA